MTCKIFFDQMLATNTQDGIRWDLTIFLCFYVVRQFSNFMYDVYSRNVCKRRECALVLKPQEKSLKANILLC
jgi:hypothetical protein